MVKQIAQLLKNSPNRFYRKARETTGEKVNSVKKDNIATEETRASEAEAVPVPLSSEVILREEESISINEKLAREIIQNGIKCEAVTNIGSLRIETKPPYSFLFSLSPRIVTNRGYIRLTQDNAYNFWKWKIQILYRHKKWSAFLASWRSICCLFTKYEL
jgi:hypothetical protein